MAEMMTFYTMMNQSICRLQTGVTEILDVRDPVPALGCRGFKLKLKGLSAFCILI